MTCRTSATACCCSNASRVSVDQPGVLDRDDRLVGKGADQLDLPLGERLDPLRRERNDADRLAFAQQRHAEHRADLSTLIVSGTVYSGIGREVGDVDDPPLQQQRAQSRCRGPGQKTDLA